MKLYIQLEHDDETKAATVTGLNSAIEAWLPEAGTKATQILAPNMDAIEADAEEGIEEDLEEYLEETVADVGLYIEVKRRAELKTPLNFLYTLAKKHKVEFVVGIIDDKTGEQEDVCFFGHEEGKPDAFEISNYLGL